jgi:GNAT superfamily N-acetyltransferase
MNMIYYSVGALKPGKGHMDTPRQSPSTAIPARPPVPLTAPRAPANPPTARTQRVYGRLRTLRRYHGWRVVFQALLLYVVRAFMRFDRIHLYALKTPPSGMLEPSPESTRFATEEEALEVGRSPEFPQINVETVEKRLGQGRKLLLNVDDGRIAGCGWLNLEEAFIEGVDVGVGLESNEGYVFDAFTHPDFRGKRLGHNRIMFWMRHLRSIGRDTLLTDFPFDNWATLTRVDKFGFERVGTVTRMKLGPFRSVRCSKGIKSRAVRVLNG